MLHFERVIPDGAVDGGPVLVLLHGRGSDERDLMELGEALLPGAVVITPRAPFSGVPWGYGPGWAWYRFLGRDRPEPESFESAQDALNELLTALPALLPVRPGRLVLGGFSQGGTMSLAYALRQPERADLVVNFSGFLADHPSVEEGLAAGASPRVFWGHGTSDPNIPFALAVEGRERLRGAGVEVESRDYGIGHWIAPEELAEAGEWVRRKLGTSHGSDRTD